MKKIFKIKLFLLIFIIILLICIFVVFINKYNLDNTSKDFINNSTEFSLNNTNYINNNSENTNYSINIENVLDSIMDSVVGVSKIKQTDSSFLLNNSTQELGIGTGLIVSNQGYILTNEHVSGPKFSSCYITLPSGEKIDGLVSWSDSDLDLSIIKFKSESNLKCANLGNSKNLKIGKKVYAIGNPLGFEFQRTVTSGIISGLNRTVILNDNNKQSYMEDLIQTDATINPGNSGGPLITEDGKVIGINTIKITSADGIGFAVPINIIKPIIESFEKNGSFDEPSLGIFAYDKEIVPYLDSNIKIDKGVYIADVKKNSNSDKIGLRIGDIITFIDDYEINSMVDLKSYIYSKDIGDTVILKINRNNIELNLPIKLTKK